MIRLVGPGGAGKSTVGAVLAGRLACRFHDLDREFERRHGDIDAFVAAHGYEAYARANVGVYLRLVQDLPARRSVVLALSSGFMVYPVHVHAAYESLSAAIAADRTTVVLLPSLDRDVCVAETVRRQLGHPFGRRDAAREETVIRERFDRYRTLPAAKVETIRPPSEVAEAILATLALRSSTSARPIRSSPARRAEAHAAARGSPH